LLRLPLVVFQIALRLLGLISSNSADDGVLLPRNPVAGALCVTLRLGGFVLCFTGSVLFLDFKSMRNVQKKEPRRTNLARLLP
jgi:hypothetical protein